jgi:uncharacterized protein YqgC (DUF456 family)
LKIKKLILILGFALISIQALALDYYAEAKDKVFNLNPSFEPDYKLDTKPPLDSARVIGEFLAGIAGGAALGYLGYWATYQKQSGWGPNLSGAPALIVGVTLGTSIGVWAIGSIGNQTGSIGGAMIGTLLGIACSLPLYIGGGDDGPMATAIFAEIGAVALFNGTRRYKAGRSMAALINYQDGKPSFNIPRISISPSHLCPGTARFSVDLVSIEL